MEMFNDKIEVGIQAIIIGTRYPENAHLIGKIVTVEALYEKGEQLDHLFYPATKVKAGHTLAHISAGGLYLELNGGSMPNNESLLQPKYLMPLPPLKEKTKEKEATLA